MDIKIVRDLTRLMRDNGLIELSVESDELKVSLKKPTPPESLPQQQMVVPMHLGAQSPVPPSAPPVAAAVPPDGEAREEADLAGCKTVVSPIPGTVYLKPDPESDPFVTAGSDVSEGQVVCMVEAMKVFNEIKCEGASGKVRKICVEDGQAVEYGTVLLYVG